MSEPEGRWHWLIAIREPREVLSWNLAQWERVVRMARRLRLLARLAESVDAAGLSAQLPPLPARLLRSELIESRHRTTIVAWAARRIGAVLRDLDVSLVLLKGGAYLAQGLPVAAGRLPSDLDILVPKADLARVQAVLQQAGWQEVELDEHDQRYYREWSHEVPPMRHEIHTIELDLHHNILPPVARTRVDAKLLLQHLSPSNWPGWFVFAPVDQVLHSAAHLFLDSEPLERIRDLVDIDGLLRHFGARDPAFWQALPQRAVELGLTEPLALACHFCCRWLHTPVPNDVAMSIARQGPGTIRRRWLLPLFEALLTPTEPDQHRPLRQRLAAWVVLVRYHCQRMPLSILLPHLWRKYRKSLLAIEPAAPAAP